MREAPKPTAPAIGFRSLRGKPRVQDALLKPVAVVCSPTRLPGTPGRTLRMSRPRGKSPLTLPTAPPRLLEDILGGPEVVLGGATFVLMAVALELVRSARASFVGHRLEVSDAASAGCPPPEWHVPGRRWCGSVSRFGQPGVGGLPTNWPHCREISGEGRSCLRRQGSPPRRDHFPPRAVRLTKPRRTPKNAKPSIHAAASPPRR